MTLQFRVGAVVLGLFVVSPAMAQLVTPPPATAPNVDDHIERFPTALPRINPDGTKAAPIKITPPPIRPKLTKVEAPDLKFESIVRRDAHGTVIPLGEPVDLAALRNNPALKPGFMDEITDLLAERKAAFQRLAIDNLDIVEQVDGGVIEKADFASKAGITTLVNLLKPLVPKAAPDPLTKVLLDQEKITPEQAAMNRKIMKEYQDALLPPLPAKSATPAERAAFAHTTIGIIQRENVTETMLTFDALRRTALAHLAQCLPADLGKPEADKLLAAAHGVGPTSAPAEVVAAYKALETGLNIDQRRDVLRKAAALAGK